MTLNLNNSSGPLSFRTSIFLQIPPLYIHSLIFILLLFPNGRAKPLLLKKCTLLTLLQKILGTFGNMGLGILQQVSDSDLIESK